jgi:hypothetical protein
MIVHRQGHRASPESLTPNFCFMSFEGAAFADNVNLSCRTDTAETTSPMQS